MRISRRLAPVAALLAAACGAGMGGPSVPAPVNGFRPEDRVVVGDFSRVNAIAATTDRVYVMYPSAVAIWRPLERRWDVPRAPAIAGRLRDVTRAFIDPVDRSLWLGTSGGFIHYDPLANRWDEGVMAQPVNRLVPGTTVDDAMRDLPQLRGMASSLAIGPLMAQGTLTSAARDPAGNGWFIGTSNRGLLFFDRMATSPVSITLGLPGDAVGALALAPDGVWVATDYDGVHPSAVTHLATELDQSATIAGTPSRGLLFNQSHRILVAGDTLWVATEKGVLRMIRNGDRIDRFDGTAGLPDDHVVALAHYRGRIVAGTMRGLAHSRGDSAFIASNELMGEPVYSLFAAGDTLWVGTSRGLFAQLPGSDALRMPESYRALAGSSVAVMAIGYVADTLVTMTQSQLLWRDPASGAWHDGPVLDRELGPLTEFVPYANGAWVGGPRGAAFVRPVAGGLRYILGPGDLPGPLTAIAAHGQYLWIGTRAGLVRFLLVGQ